VDVICAEIKVSRLGGGGGPVEIKGNEWKKGHSSERSEGRPSRLEALRF
jgi:hypothetical protein